MRCLLLLVVYTLAALAHPIVEVNPDCKNCIRMTKEAEEEIEDIISEIGDFIINLLKIHQRFHIKHAKFEIEKHNDKDVLFEITINDCPDSYIDSVEENKKNIIPNQGSQKAKNTEETNTNQEQISNQSVTDKTKEEQVQQIKESEKQNGGPKKPVKPEIMMLDLDELGMDLMKRLDEKRGKNAPLIVYVQKFEGHEAQGQKVVFLNRK